MVDSLGDIAGLPVRHTLALIVASPSLVYFVFAARTVLFTTLEKLRPARPHTYWPNAWRDVVAVATYVWVITPVAYFLNRYFPGPQHYAFSVAAIPIPMRIVLYLAVADFGYYWVHRLMHTRYVWRAHMWHHSPRFLYWLSGMRASVPQQFLVNIPYILAYPLLGTLEWWMYVLIAMHVGFKNDWQHMNVTWPSRWLEWILVTPRFHQVHHSDDPQHYVANLGDLLTVWDRLFGTYVDPASIRKELTFGIDSNPSTARLVLGV
jgi:sterol desaturase/sphingolipid hydroxylase (fatty acid hydroxylase superfamily)